MNVRSVVVMGLPGSGKTTFLAALWHLLTSKEVDSQLKLASLRCGNPDHLKAIAALWRDARKQERTSLSSDKLVSIALRAEGGEPRTVNFPDVRGEAFQEMWERRECEEQLAGWLRETGVLLFVHANKFKSPRWVIQDKLLAEDLASEEEEVAPEVVDWAPELAPTQVQLTDLLQSMQCAPLDVGPRRLAIVLSAWDKVAGRGLSPEQYLATKLPLFAQFLQHGLDQRWQYRVYGVSAQGADYDDLKNTSAAADGMRAVDRPTERITVVHGGEKSHDLTAPLQWLLT